MSNESFDSVQQSHFTGLFPKKMLAWDIWLMVYFSKLIDTIQKHISPPVPLAPPTRVNLWAISSCQPSIQFVCSTYVGKTMTSVYGEDNDNLD